MERKIVLASHHRLAAGLKDTLDFITNGMADVIALTAYLDNQPVEEQVQALMTSFDDETEVVVLTDMTAGSVNQKFFAFRNRPHTQIISGMNLPLALGFAMEPVNDYLQTERIKSLIEQAQAEITYVNDIQPEIDDDDE